jgi:hypothetical protein
LRHTVTKVVGVRFRATSHIVQMTDSQTESAVIAMNALAILHPPHAGTSGTADAHHAPVQHEGLQRRGHHRDVASLSRSAGTAAYVLIELLASPLGLAHPIGAPRRRTPLSQGSVQ